MRYDVIFSVDTADERKQRSLAHRLESKMRHTDYRTLVDRGRKAGLKTTDIYSALSARRPEAGDRNFGEADGNGYVPGFGRQGQNVIHPFENR